MSGTVPTWIWAGTAVIAVPVIVVVLALLWEMTRPRPALTLRDRGTRIELWLGGPKMPGRADAVLVPVAPDLVLAAGSARWVRGVTAGVSQAHAERLAPREPGEALLVPGSRGRFRYAVLAVVMDSRKRYSDEWAIAAARATAKLASCEGIASILIPDWTPDLMSQPRTQDAAFRQREAARIAPLVLDVAEALVGEVTCVRVWVPDRATAEVYREELGKRQLHHAVAA